MTRRAVYFVSTEFGEIHHGPAIYAKNLWNFFAEQTEFDFHMVVLSSDLKHPRVHVEKLNSVRRRGFYRRLERHILATVPANQPNTILHCNAAHLISPKIASRHRTIVQINDTEVCQHQLSWATLRQLGVRRTAALCWRRRREYRVANFSEKIICNSDFTNSAVKNTYQIDSTKLHRIYKSVPLSPFLKTTPLNNDAHSRFNLIFVGSNWIRKGLDTLLESVRRIDEQRVGLSLHLSIFGYPGKAVEKYFRRLANKKGIRNQVSFGGVISREELPHAMAKANVLLLPSYEEALGLSAIEALATGIPVIGSNVGGIPEIINSPKLGWLCKPGDPDSLASAIVNASLQTPSNNTDLITYRKTSSRRFSVDLLKENVSSLYRSLFD